MRNDINRIVSQILTGALSDIISKIMSGKFFCKIFLAHILKGGSLYRMKFEHTMYGRSANWMPVKPKRNYVTAVVTDTI